MLQTSDKDEACLEAELASIFWHPVGDGAYHSVSYTERRNIRLASDSTYTGPWAYREAKVLTAPPQEETNTDHQIAHPARQKRLFNAINVSWAVGIFPKGVVTPFFKGSAASDDERVKTVLEIYQKTGRIVIDAMVSDNILSNGKTVYCVDVDLALRSDSPASQLFFSLSLEDTGKVDRKLWAEKLLDALFADFYLIRPDYPKTLELLGALCYLEKYFNPADIKEAYLSEQILQRVSWCRERERSLTHQKMAELMSDGWPGAHMISQQYGDALLSDEEFEPATAWEQCVLL